MRRGVYPTLQQHYPRLKPVPSYYSQMLNQALSSNFVSGYGGRSTTGRSEPIWTEAQLKDTFAKLFGPTGNTPELKEPVKIAKDLFGRLLAGDKDLFDPLVELLNEIKKVRDGGTFDSEALKAKAVFGKLNLK